MLVSRKKTLNRLRNILLSLISLFGVALLITPASAASQTIDLDRSALVLITLFGTLLFAIVFEVWRTVSSRPAPIQNRATQDWTPERRD